MQVFKAGDYQGTRLRLSAFARASGVEGSAGLWMRIDGSHQEMLAFDNMHERPIRGTADWQKFEIVLDVPETSEVIAFGLLLQGAGRVWLDDIEFDPVGDDIDITGTQGSSLIPMNLDFEIIDEESASGH
jgi:hypothetical protein